ncbi:hypothetical protein BJV77DRAFT_1035668 [Russula vinacea]|nr:hypothetical protein BJV77DRAFT_1035668 [Russula vinacea]
MSAPSLPMPRRTEQRSACCGWHCTLHRHHLCDLQLVRLLQPAQPAGQSSHSPTDSTRKRSRVRKEPVRLRLRWWSIVIVVAAIPASGAQCLRRPVHLRSHHGVCSGALPSAATVLPASAWRAPNHIRPEECRMIVLRGVKYLSGKLRKVHCALLLLS